MVTYGCETWELIKENEKILNVWESKLIRRIHGPICEVGHWRNRMNAEL